MKYKYKENVDKANHLYEMLLFLESGEIDYLVFNLKNAVCEIIINEYAFEITFKNSEETPESMIYHDTSKIEFYRLMLFVTDNVRVMSELVCND